MRDASSSPPIGALLSGFALLVKHRTADDFRAQLQPIVDSLKFAQL